MALKVTHGLIDVFAALERLIACSAGRQRDALRDVAEAERLSRCVAVRIREQDVDVHEAHSELIISAAESQLMQ